jgi:hypothetical protein
MNLDAELQGIVRENEGDLLVFARKLYEHGYRQGLAARPAAAGETVATAPTASPPPAPPTHGPLFPSRPKLVDVPDDDAGEPEEADTASDDEASTCDHRVRASITVAGLQRKIERLFDLSRFDVDIVICRRGDPERRRLKAGVKLRNYLLESE